MGTDETSESGIEPIAERPRMFGSHPQPVPLPWKWAVGRLEAAENYWIATTRPDGRPHVRPVWAVWLDGALYFSTGSLAVQNLAVNPELSVNLESGGEAVILEGAAETVDDQTLTARICAVYNAKYDWDLDPDALPGGFYALRPRVAFGWISDKSSGGSLFRGTATRWRFR